MTDFAPSADALRADVERLARAIGARNIYHFEELQRAASLIDSAFSEAGLAPMRREYEAKGKRFANLEAEVRGTALADEIFVVGAHYDTRRHSPGANDNGSGVAAMLALARHFAARPAKRTIRFVAFVNEERPFLRTRKMGSRVYASECRERNETITGMLSLETIGYRSTRKGSQWLSLFGLVAPRTGDFIAIVANRRSKELLTRSVNAFRSAPSAVPCEHFVLPTNFPGAWSSDHWSFWKEGYPALMLTDTAPLRYRHYHRRSDTPDKLHYEFLAGVVAGVERVVTAAADR